MEELSGNAHGAKASAVQPETRQPALSMRGFTFAYPRSAPVLKEVDFTAEQGEFVLLTGATGSGKTTFLRCFKPELTPVGEQSGQVRTQGSVGYVAQNPETQIVCDSVWHEMAFGLENAGVSSDEMRVRVAEVAYFFGMEPWFDAKVNELSGGQKQLLNLAAVLALRPSVLLLDEPTSQLDPLAARDFAHALFRVNRELGLTVVVATHAPQVLARYATRSVVLEGGKVLRGEGTRRELAAQNDAGASLAMPPAAPCAGDASCKLREVFARYAKDARPVLRGMSLEVAQGEIHALIGGNGCGKTTALKVVASVMAPYRGKVSKAKGTQAYLPQDPHALFMADSVAEELALWQHTAARPYTAGDIASVCERFGLAGLAQQHPYDLSGGQQQLLAFAKLFLTRPDLYLLDEPMKGLDAAARATLISALREEAARGAAILVATHDMAFVAEACTRVSFLFDGQVAATQAPADFFAQNLFFRPFLAETV